MGARQVVSFCAIPTLTPREVKNLILLFVGAPLVSRLVTLLSDPIFLFRCHKGSPKPLLAPAVILVKAVCVRHTCPGGLSPTLFWGLPLV